jgi:tetratricopeptide (TPR) repeat protein
VKSASVTRPLATRVITGDAATALALRLLIQHQQWRTGLALLQTLPPSVRRQPGYLYLEAQIFRKIGHRREAIDLYSRLLTDDPTRQAARLELAQTYFEVRDDRSSEQYFRLALSGELSAADATLVHQYLAAIRQRGSWKFTLSAAIAPDSDLNAASSIRSVELFGLPFDVNANARAKSGVSSSVEASADRSIPVMGPYRLEVGGYGRYLYNSGGLFNQATVGAYAGPQVVIGERVFSLLGGVEHFDYSNRTLYNAGRISLNASVPTEPTVLYQGSLAVQRLSFPSYPGFDAWLTSVSGTRTKFLSPTRFWSVAATVGENDAASAAQTYRLGQVSVGYFQTLPLGLGFYVSPSVTIKDFRGADLIFDRHRTDYELSLTGRLIDKAISFDGFSPFVGGALSRVRSTVGFYSYPRARMEIGITRSF